MSPLAPPVDVHPVGVHHGGAPLLAVGSVRQCAALVAAAAVLEGEDAGHAALAAAGGKAPCVLIGGIEWNRIGWYFLFRQLTARAGARRSVGGDVIEILAAAAPAIFRAS